MIETIKKGDFIELDFTGTADGEIFDTTNNELAKKLFNKEAKPVKIIVGERMIIEGLDNSLEGKEIGKEYRIELKPNESFGERKPELIKVFPINAFKDKNMLREGNTLIIEGYIARIVKVGSGRVMLDFNHPLAGKKIEYKFKILRKIEDNKEKISSILEYFGIKDYKIEEKEGKIILRLEKRIEKEIENLIKRHLNNIEIILKE